MEDKPHHQWKTVRHRSEVEDRFVYPLPEGFYGYVPNYPPPSESLDTNPFNLIEGNENKLY